MPLLSTTSPLLGKTTHSMDSQASSGGRAFKRDSLNWWIGSPNIYPNIGQLLPMNQPFTASLARSGIRYRKLKITDKHDFGDRLWNCDESGVCTSVVSSMVLARRGAKWVHETTGGSGREITTIHVGGSASERRLPPFLVYKGKHWYSS